MFGLMALFCKLLTVLFVSCVVMSPLQSSAANFELSGPIRVLEFPYIREYFDQDVIYQWLDPNEFPGMILLRHSLESVERNKKFKSVLIAYLRNIRSTDAGKRIHSQIVNSSNQFLLFGRPLNRNKSIHTIFFNVSALPRPWHQQCATTFGFCIHGQGSATSTVDPNSNRGTGSPVLMGLHEPEVMISLMPATLPRGAEHERAIFSQIISHEFSHWYAAMVGAMPPNTGRSNITLRRLSMLSSSWLEEFVNSGAFGDHYTMKYRDGVSELTLTRQLNAKGFLTYEPHPFGYANYYSVFRYINVIRRHDPELYRILEAIPESPVGKRRSRRNRKRSRQLSY